ncbi:hypothetical protein ACU5B6_12150 [Moritella viscosa]|uniref:hypothetical protein n=1 Tax=Moritella viscosa TaxID=80854 RepID=UPI0009190360|nr:hypothetical protein [Moritella viscosa]SHO14474.1 Putative uncharacterized protein [Moritella viscosa]SHO15371.1 Putative uncharacterized protein [Moritella viscosa]SHO18974.1 Putative uncharacterized protein [Moritella viscosa]
MRVKNIKTLDLSDWLVPERRELWDLAKDITNPLHEGYHCYLFNNNCFAVTDGRLQLRHNEHFDQNCDGWLLSLNKLLIKLTTQQIIETALDKNWVFKAHKKDIKLFSSDFIVTYLSNLDYSRARLPKIESAQITDPNKGMWEFFENELSEYAKKSGMIARNPVDDIVKNSNVSIDFGTSSTVVAYQNKGLKKLLRIGVKDFFSVPEQKHFENPTVLEFIDIPAMLEAWQNEAYRPSVLWDDVRCSHEAQTRFRDNDGDTDILASILTKIKQWALRSEEEDQQVRIAGQEHSTELLLPSLTLRQPIKGQTLSVSDRDEFDPIELYAWFLGLNINWRQRGLFLKYYMTFPVDYAKQTKNKILASFRRGLQRSFPKELISQAEFSQFAVEERASEPAAYAAAALPALDIEPNDDGIPYAVFDFGGGTTDFDFGIYRNATEEEEDDDGYEDVFEHFGAAGDRFLGGENLLENMAYQTFEDNISVCRDHKVAFTCPLDAKPFAGSEMFIDRTQAAQTNTLMLIAKLRPLWEEGKLETNTIKLNFLNRDGEKKNCEFKINSDALLTYLRERISKGVHNFYDAMKKAFQGKNAQKIHILLAGNSSQSEIVKHVFSLADPSIAASVNENTDEPAMVSAAIAALFSEVVIEQEAIAQDPKEDEFLNALYQSNPPELVVHLPLQADNDDPYKPTCKTGVALGLLSLCPGSATKVINHMTALTEGEAPFAFHVGRIRRKCFNVGLKQGVVYGTWNLLGPIRERVFELYASQSSSASDNLLPVTDPSLQSMNIEFAGDTEKHKVFARAVGPKTIEVCTAVDQQAVESGTFENLEEILLK